MSYAILGFGKMGEALARKNINVTVARELRFQNVRLDRTPTAIREEERFR